MRYTGTWLPPVHTASSGLLGCHARLCAAAECLEPLHTCSTSLHFESVRIKHKQLGGRLAEVVQVATSQPAQLPVSLNWMGSMRHLRGSAVSAAWYAVHVPLACCNLQHDYVTVAVFS